MNKLKKDGKKMQLLREVEKRSEYGMTTDRECCPPAKIMQPLEKAGLVYRKRVGGWNWFKPHLRITKWFLTPKGRKALNG